MSNFRDAVARLLVDHRQVGTAWLMSNSLACTAHHCVKECNLDDEVSLEFPSLRLSGRILALDTDLDVAIIRLEREHPIRVLSTVARPTNPPPQHDWLLHGFPVDLLGLDVSNSGISLTGVIANFSSHILGSPRIQLSCPEGGKVPKGQKSPFAGISGSPVVVRIRDQDESLSVIGVVSEHPNQTDAIIFCTPIEAVIERYADIASSVVLQSWDAYRGLPFVVEDQDRAIRTNIDEHVIEQIWNGNLLGFWCNIRSDESIWLTTAIERLVVHAPFSQTSEVTELHFTGAASWRSRCQYFSTEWLPVHDLAPDQAISKYQFLENPGGRLPLGGQRFATKDELAVFLQDLCNIWAMNHLRDRMVQIFGDPKGYLKYQIAPEIVSQMRLIWDGWIKSLLSCQVLRHHFLGLMLTGNGSQSMVGTAAGVGPTTLMTCVVQTVAFTLAICAGLPTSIQGPKNYNPGNLGDADLNGHSCGVQTLGGSLLQMADRSHQWTTSFVMLPHLSEAWEAFANKHSRLDKSSNHASQSFNEQPFASVVIPRDTELLAAFGKGLDDLRILLSDRCSALVQQQESYVQGATDVEA